MRGVDSSDAYLLLLGPHYGHTFPETGQSATHDEWVRAQTLGLPRYVFRKIGVRFDDDQALFAASLGDYATDRFYKEFEQPHDLLREVTAAIRELETAGGNLEFSPLTDPPSVPWLESTPGWGSTEALLEVHVIPMEGRPLSARVLSQLEQGLPHHLRESGLIAPAAGVETTHVNDRVSATIPPPGTSSRAGLRTGGPALVRVDSQGRCTIAFRLPGDSMGSVLDESEITSRIASALRLSGRLDLTDAPRFAVGVGISSASMVSIGSVSALPRSSSSLRMNSGPVRVTPDESMTRAGLDRGADEVATSLARTLMRSFETDGR